MKNCQFERKNDGFKCINCGFFIRGEFPDGIFRNCQKPPSTIQNIKNKTNDISSAIVNVAKEGTTNQDLQKERLKICESCEHYSGDSCKLCGCFMKLKTMVKNANCPIGKW